MIQSYEDKHHFRNQNGLFVLNKIFLLQTIFAFKIYAVDPELWRCTIFGPEMVHLLQMFFWKIITIILIYLLAPFIVEN